MCLKDVEVRLLSTDHVTHNHIMRGFSFPGFLLWSYSRLGQIPQKEPTGLISGDFNRQQEELPKFQPSSVRPLKATQSTDISQEKSCVRLYVFLSYQPTAQQRDITDTSSPSSVLTTFVVI